MNSTSVKRAAAAAPADQFLAVVKEIQATAAKVRDAVPGVHEKIAPTSKGLSFLEVKNQSIITYLISLCHLMSAKLDGQEPAAWASMDALLESRVLLEKIKPMESKLKYRIDKLLKLAETGEQKDALSFKPNLADFDADAAADEMDGGDSEDEERTAAAKAGVYRPPKLAPVRYEEGGAAARQRVNQRAVAAASRSRLMRDLEEEFGDAPEVRTAGLVESAATEQIDAHFAERTAFEEDNFLRLNLTRKDKKLAKQRERVSMGDEVRELMADFADSDEEERRPARKTHPGQRAERRERGDDSRNHVDEMIGFLESKRAATNKRKRTARDEDDGSVQLIDGHRGNKDDYARVKAKASKNLQRAVSRDKKRARKAAARDE
ncbi:hypothetical protein H9P43_007941 [Blastocladiella emersonii ATCC 22665]|nr:hypothetical protein H9P43_007941 [Blastocladiella emersonii ATCC 22665]